MFKYKIVTILLITFTLSACGTLRNVGIGVGKDGTVSAYNNLDRHGAIALFQSQEGKACYDTIKEAIEFDIIDDKVKDKMVTQPREGATAFDAIIAQTNAMADLAKNSMKYAAHMVAYSNGIAPVDPIVQLASLCKRTNYYDAVVAKSDNRHETYRAIASEVGDVLKTTTPYAALAYIGSKVGDRNDISGNNNGVGNNNAVGEPVIVDPTVVADGENVSTPPLPEDPNVIPEDPNVIPVDPNLF